MASEDGRRDCLVMSFAEEETEFPPRQALLNYVLLVFMNHNDEVPVTQTFFTGELDSFVHNFT